MGESIKALEVLQKFIPIETLLEIPESTDLFDLDLLDSLKAFAVLSVLQEEFGVSLLEEAQNLDFIRTIKSLQTWIDERKNSS
jgi:acyl carrier protein